LPASRKAGTPLFRRIAAFLLAAASLLSGTANCAPFSFHTLPYPFTDDQGKTLHLSDWRSRPLILTMEYSECRFMCSVTFTQLKDIQAAADEKKIAIDFVVISLDPKNDTPAAWREYRVRRGVERDNWHLLTGSEAAMAEVAARLGIRYWYMGEHLLHDFKVVRLNAAGEIEKSLTVYGKDPAWLLLPAGQSAD